MNISAVWMVLNASVNKSLKRNKMKRKLWIRIGAVVLAALLLWWLFWAILIDEDENDQGLPETEQIEAVD